MKRNSKKGFTIVELVIVIAVIAILAAVLIPTYSSLVKKANQSADIQAVRQMNTVLATYTDGKISTISKAIEVLDKENISLENYKALQKDHYIYFTTDKNGNGTVIYANKNGEIVFPKDHNVPENAQWMSLSGEVPIDDNYKIDSGSVTLSSGAQLVHFMENQLAELNADSRVETIRIKLTGKIDMMGSTATFDKFNKDIEIDGNSATLSGLREYTNALASSFNDSTKLYGYGLFGEVPQNTTVTIKNLNLSDVVVENKGDKAFGHSAVLFGRVLGTVNIENVTIADCAVYGGDKVGALIGYLYADATANIKNVKVQNTTVAGAAFVAKAIGYVCDDAKVSIDVLDCSTVTTAINEDAWPSIWNNSDKNWMTDDIVKMDDAKVYEVVSDKDTLIPLINEGNCFYGVLTENNYWKAGWKDVSYNGTTYKCAESANN